MGGNKHPGASRHHSWPGWPGVVVSVRRRIQCHRALGLRRFRPYFAPALSFEAIAHSAITVKYFCTLSAPAMNG